MYLSTMRVRIAILAWVLLMYWGNFRNVPILGHFTSIPIFYYKVPKYSPQGYQNPNVVPFIPSLVYINRRTTFVIIKYIWIGYHNLARKKERCLLFLCVWQFQSWEIKHTHIYLVKNFLYKPFFSMYFFLCRMIFANLCKESLEKTRFCSPH